MEGDKRRGGLTGRRPIVASSQKMTGTMQLLYFERGIRDKCTPNQGMALKLIKLVPGIIVTSERLEEKKCYTGASRP